MSRLFFCNVKPQYLSFSFRIPRLGNNGIWNLNDMRPVTCMQIFHDTDKETLDSFLKQVIHYGFESYETSMKNMDYSGLSYIYDRPFTRKEILSLKDHYDFCKTINGEKRRQKSIQKSAEILTGSMLRSNPDLGQYMHDSNNMGITVRQINAPYENNAGINEEYSPAF